MNKEHRFWPFNPKANIFISIFLFFILLIMLGIFRYIAEWPGVNSESTILIGIIIISLLPIILNILDVIIDRGGKVEYGSIKIDFSKVEIKGVSNIIIPPSILLHGQQVSDSGPINIFKSLEGVSRDSIAILDLEDGNAWWETRLLVLLSGAERLKYPNKIVFIADNAGEKQSFVGWGYTVDLLRCLLKSNENYLRFYSLGKAVSAQWNLVEPVFIFTPQNSIVPDPLPWMQNTATYMGRVKFDYKTGLPNEYFEEQVLLEYVVNQIEVKEGGKCINLSSINTLFNSVLNRNYIEKNWTNEEQMKCYFSEDSSFIAMTDNKKYVSLVSRFSVFNEVLKDLTSKKNS